MPENEEKRVWGMHSTDDYLFLKESIVALGWKELGDLSNVERTREAYKDFYAESYPGSKKLSISTSAGMIYRFCVEMQVGDYVVFPSKPDRMVNIGQITGEYYFEPSADLYVHRRKVKWLEHLPRTLFSQGALYELGASMSFFAIKNYPDEYLAALDKGFKKKALTEKGADESVAATADGIIESTKDFVLKELSRQLKGHDMELFVANLLNAMGYRATVSPKGGDRGIDITAYKDELPPRIIVQVKSQDSDIRETTLQSLKGAMKSGDYGLFVTLSNYTKNAEIFLDENPMIRGINGSELVDLILKYYELLSEKYQKVIPLKKVYIPVPSTEEL